MAGTADLIAAIDRLTAAVTALARPLPPEPPEPAKCQRCAGEGEFAPGVPCSACAGTGHVGAGDAVS